MSLPAPVMVALYLAVLIALAYPLAIYMARIADARPMRGPVGGFERLLYRAAAVDPAHDMPWTQYAVAVLLFNALGALVVYGVQRLQVWLPLNPQGFANVSADSAFDTAVSFVTNTNWQGYSGESTMSYATQMAALAVQNFFSAATGIAVAFALIRGFARGSAQGVGNFWVDMTRGTLYLLLPLSFGLALLFMGQGVIQNFDSYKDASTLESLTYANPKLDAAGAAAQGCAGQSDHRDRDDANPDAPDGTGCLARGDQDAGHQRGRLLQRQFGAPVRESDAVDQFRADGRDAADPGGAVLRVRSHGRGHAPGLGHLGDDDHHPRGHDLGGDLGRTAGQSVVRAARRRSDAQCAAGRRQHGRQGVALRHHLVGAVREHHDRGVLRRRQRACTIRSLRSAAWCRCG